MSRPIIAAARQISGEMRGSENEMDQALANNARLVATLLDARREAKLPASIGRNAVKCGIEAIAYGAKARESLLEMHQELAALNLRELATGDLSACPEDWATMGKLQLVPSQTEQAA